ncbi:paraquat-inducible protein B, partial [Pseudomonas aeruginosa]
GVGAQDRPEERGPLMSHRTAAA